MIMGTSSWEGDAYLSRYSSGLRAGWPEFYSWQEQENRVAMMAIPYP
jgi:hypothetical protein